MRAPRHHATERDASRVAHVPAEGDFVAYEVVSGTLRVLARSADREAVARAVDRSKGHPALLTRAGVLLRGTNLPDTRTLEHLRAEVLRLHQSPATRRDEGAAPRTTPPPATPAAPRAVRSPRTTPTETTMPKTTKSEAPKTDDTATTPKLCEKCGEHPQSAVTHHTPKGTETWCKHCRRVEAMRRNGNSTGRRAKSSRRAATRGSQVKREARPAKARRTVTKPPCAEAVACEGLPAELVPAARALRVVASLGGIDRAEQIARAVGTGA